MEQGEDPQRGVGDGVVREFVHAYETGQARPGGRRPLEYYHNMRILRSSGQPQPGALQATPLRGSPRFIGPYYPTKRR